MRLQARKETRELVVGIFVNFTRHEAEKVATGLATLGSQVDGELNNFRRELLSMLNGTASSETLGAADRHLAQINAERFGEREPMPHTAELISRYSPPEYKPWKGTAAPLPNSPLAAHMNAAMEEVHDHLLEATDKESLSRISTRRMLRDLYRKGFHAGVDWHKAQQNVTELVTQQRTEIARLSDVARNHREAKVEAERELRHYKSLTTTWKNRATAAESEIRQLRARRESLTEKWRERAEHFREQVRKGYDAQAGVKARMLDVMSSELNDRFNRTIEPESLEPVDEPPTPLPDINASSNQVQRQLDGAARELGIRLSQKDRQILTTLWSTAYSQGVVDNEKRWSS